VALVGNPDRGKTILIRADMDALETEEKTGLSFASERKGYMHACGHDIHIANALAAAYILKKHESKLNGCVKFVFQPAEETTGGAQPMISEGVLENPHVDVCIGAHVSAMYPTGELYFKEGALMASPDDFELAFIGKSTHGAEPQNGINPLNPACEFVLNINRKLSEAISFEQNVFSICSVNGGNSNNIIPDTACILGTFRSFSQGDREKADSIICSFAKELCTKYNCGYSCTYNYLYPPLVNNSKMTELAKKCAHRIVGAENVKKFEKPLMTGEDFSYFACERPSVFVWAGCGKDKSPIPLHSSHFVADENVIEVVASLFCDFVFEYLGNNNS